MDLQRFNVAQAGGVFETALAEITAGCKQSHWMWFIFPQFKGLGRSSTSAYYAIQSLDEARAYLANPLLGQRLRKICEALLALPGNDPKAVFGTPDWMKLQSSMTLFDTVSPDDIFDKVLAKYFDGKRDTVSIALMR